MRDCMNEDGGAARRIHEVTVGLTRVEADAAVYALDFARKHGAFDDVPEMKAQAVRAEKRITEAKERGR